MFCSFEANAVLSVACQGRLCAAFDATYITTTLAQLALHKEKGMVGGVWNVGETDQSFLDLAQDIKVDRVNKASSILEVVLWDPAAVRRVQLPVATTPFETNFSGPGSTMRGCWFMLELMGMILKEGADIIRCITFDAHGSHSMIRKILHGQNDGSYDDALRLPFWRDLEWVHLPSSCLPRCPIKICMHNNEAIYGIPECYLDEFLLVVFFSGHAFCSNSESLTLIT